TPNNINTPTFPHFNKPITHHARLSHLHLLAHQSISSNRQPCRMKHPVFILFNFIRRHLSLKNMFTLQSIVKSYQEEAKQNNDDLRQYLRHSMFRSLKRTRWMF
ncbi:hypothetical protein Tcan_02423, partial [Toxocara canis]